MCQTQLDSGTVVPLLRENSLLNVVVFRCVVILKHEVRTEEQVRRISVALKVVDAEVDQMLRLGVVGPSWSRSLEVLC